MAPQRVQRFYSPRTTLDGYSAAAFSPDGGTLATWASSGNAVSLWDRASLRQRAALPLPGVITADFSRDGRTLATSSSTALQLWDTRSGELRSTLDGPRGVTDLAFSADGKGLTVLTDKGKTVSRWDIATQQMQGDPKRFPARAALSADGATVATTSGDGATIMLWDLPTGQWKARLQWGTENLAQAVLAFSPDGQMLVASSASTVKVWDVAAGALHATFDVRPANIQRLAFSPDGTLLALRDGVKVTLWHLASQSRKAVLQNLARPAGTLAFSPDGRTLATGCGLGQDSRVKLWDLP
jgi:WD40 repeat protein